MRLSRDTVKKNSFFLILIFFFSAHLQAININDLQDKMAESDSSLTSIRFDYSQETRSGLTSEVRSSSGTAYFRKPKHLRVEQKGPEPQLIVSSGKNVFIYTPRFRQVIKDSWKNWFSRNLFFPGLIGFSETLQRLKKEYHWEILGAEEIGGIKTLTVRLKSLSGGSSEYLNLWVGESDFLPRKAEQVYGTFKMTTIFDDLQRNPELKSELFNFRQPPKSEMISLP